MVAGMAGDIPEIGIDIDADVGVLVLGWGSILGDITAGARRVRANGHKVAQVHLRYLNPLPKNLEEILLRYPKVLIPELNRGQLRKLIRAEYMIDATSYSKVQGQPFKPVEIESKLMEMLKS